MNKYLYNKERLEMSEKTMSASEKKKEDWMNTKWRPMMGWMYMLVCVADFVLFPVLWSMAQALHGGSVQTQWQPITLQGAGLFHIAMGAILGIAVYGRTQEKMNGATGASSAAVSMPSVGSMGGFTQSSPSFQPVAYNAPQSGQTGYSTGGIAAGKARPAEPEYPIL
jgi:hypothetical protein